jgi:ABC-type molybdenum transport system ATPase subunit/photorepair protein PhrA
LLIAAIACYRGLSVKAAAAGVGTATTSSVVTANHRRNRQSDTLYNVVYHEFFPDMSAHNSHMVELRDVKKEFEDKKVLDGVSLKLEPGDAVVVIGPERKRQRARSCV